MSFRPPRVPHSSDREMPTRPVRGGDTRARAPTRRLRCPQSGRGAGGRWPAGRGPTPLTPPPAATDQRGCGVGRQFWGEQETGARPWACDFP